MSVIFILVISVAILYWVVKSAINDSELVTLLRSIDHKLDQMKKVNDDIRLKEEEVQGHQVDQCPACNAWIRIDNTSCPECGIVFLDE